MRNNHLIIVFTLLITFFCSSINAQTGDPKVDAMLKELKKAPGKITFTINQKKYTEVASFLEDDKKGLNMSSHLTLDNTPNVTIALNVPTKKSGTYSIEGNKAGVVQIKEKAYQIKGNIILKVSGKKITGTFEGELYEINKNKTKPSEKSSGKITGSFNN